MHLIDALIDGGDRTQVTLTFDTIFDGGTGDVAGTYDGDGGPADIDTVNGTDGADSIVIIGGTDNAVDGGTLTLTELGDVGWEDGRTLTLPQSIVMHD